jgi:hypothetical protein
VPGANVADVLVRPVAFRETSRFNAELDAHHWLGHRLTGQVQDLPTGSHEDKATAVTESERMPDRSAAGPHRSSDKRVIISAYPPCRLFATLIVRASAPFEGQNWQFGAALSFAGLRGSKAPAVLWLLSRSRIAGTSVVSR